MNTEWDYTELATAYAGRPPYADQAVDAIVAVAGVGSGARVCDVGAGTGHLTVQLTARGLVVDAVEPNHAMREIGERRTIAMPEVTWRVGTGEDTACEGGAYALVSFGSSFNVVNRRKALAETHRLLQPGGWFACLWNHRDLDDPLQASIEDLITARVPGYEPGSRRSDQRPTLRVDPRYGEAIFLEVRQIFEVERGGWVNGWRSHGTLQRQAGAEFESVVADIEALVSAQPATLLIPYTTRVYLAKVR